LRERALDDSMEMMDRSRPEATTEPPPLTRAQLVVLLFVIPTAMALLTVAYRHLDTVANGVSRPFMAPLVEELTGHYGGVLVLAPMVFLAGRIGLARRRWPAHVAFHAIGIAVYSGLHTTLNWGSREVLFPLVGLGDYDYGDIPVRYAMELPKDVSIYALVFVIAALFDRYRASRDRELRTADLEARLARAQLQNLQAQLNPHFVFNALNTISSVMYEDVARADRMLAGLSELLRRALQASRRHEVTLAEELEVLGLYVEIMRARFGERLRFDVAVEDGLADVLVPTLLLQPLVENAVRHGAPPPPEPARIEVRVRREGDDVVFEVEDNGPGLEVDGWSGAGVGLANTEARLRGLYGDAPSMTLGRGRLGGLLVAIRIPLRRNSAHALAPEEAWTGSAS
jgi:signal transduction histidine kinase